MTAPLSAAVRNRPPPVIAERVIEVRDLTKRYGPMIVHEHLDFEVRRGEIVSVVGGSGSGKTSLIRQILGLEAPTSGTIEVFGRDTSTIDEATARVMRSRMGMLFQQGALFSSMSVFDGVLYTAHTQSPTMFTSRTEGSLLRIATASEMKAR